MLSKMSYCSLDEAWSLCRPLDDIPTETPAPTVVEVGNNNNYSLTPKQLPNSNLERDFSSYLQNKNDHQSTANELSLSPSSVASPNSKRDICQLFLKHIETCPSCRKKIEEKYGNHAPVQVVEKFVNGNNGPNYFEISMILLIGIILIIIMDSFVRIGKLMVHK